MKGILENIGTSIDLFLSKKGFQLKARLIIVFLISKVIPIIFLAMISWNQIVLLGDTLKNIAINDSSNALYSSAINNVERMTTDITLRMSDFLYQRDNDIRYLSNIIPSEENYRKFLESKNGKIMDLGEWEVSDDGQSWVNTKQDVVKDYSEQNTYIDLINSDYIHVREREDFNYKDVSLYDEITFIDLDGNEQIKVVSSNSTKKNYPLDPEKKDISKKENTYIKSETYFENLEQLANDEIYVSDVIGAYVGTNYIGMYTPDVINSNEKEQGYNIDYAPELQAYSSDENPVGQHFEGIIRWSTPVFDNGGEKIGYVTFALNHVHLMEFINHITPLSERYVKIPSAHEGNYAFVWDSKCRIICHPKHHTIVGYDPETGDPQVPWLEDKIYYEWKESGIEKWTDFVESVPQFDDQSREKKLSRELEREGLVAYDGRYLNNAPQCSSWMELTQDGSSGTLYLLWEGVNKITTFAPIPYFTGQYAPSEENNFSQRGFGFVVIGAELESFTYPVKETEKLLTDTNVENRKETFYKLTITIIIILVLIVFVAIGLASSITNNITDLIEGISRFKSGDRSFRFNAVIKDEFGTLADSFDEMADSIVDSMNNPLAIIDMDRKIIYMNELSLKICKIENLSDIIGKNYSNIGIYPLDTEYCPITALENGTEAETYYIDRKYLKGKANYFLDKDNNKIGYIIETFDVTEMIYEQQKIERQKTLLDKILSASPDLIWLIDDKGVYQTVNPRFANIIGKSPRDFVGKKSEDILPSNIARVLIPNDRKVIKYKKNISSEETIVFADNHEEILDSVRTPIFDSKGNLVAILGFARNVTSRVEIENELRKIQQELEMTADEANKANKHKGEFLARMSHEIRTPMNAIIGITEILQRKIEDSNIDRDMIIENISKIEASSKHLLGLINDVLDVSKIEAGKIEFLEEVIYLPELLDTVVSMIQPRCDEKQISFITDFDTFSIPYFVTDSLRLRQVLINLLGNSVKFTPNNGKIRFSVKCKSHESNKTLIEFSVSDNGIGIADDAKEYIFQSFEQGGNNISRQYGGTGLGLSISNKIINMLGSKIDLKSELNKGSTFSFKIWLKQSEESLPSIDEISDITGKLVGKRALVVDDVDINRMIVISMLEDSGLEIDECDDGLIAINLFKESPEYTYDLIFMDIQMPRMTGYEASKAIRELNRNDAKSVYIIALTANAFKEDIDKALESGMNNHIAKPIDTDMLFKVLYKYINLV